MFRGAINDVFFFSLWPQASDALWLYCFRATKNLPSPLILAVTRWAHFFPSSSALLSWEKYNRRDVKCQQLSVHIKCRVWPSLLSSRNIVGLCEELYNLIVASEMNLLLLIHRNINCTIPNHDLIKVSSWKCYIREDTAHMTQTWVQTWHSYAVALSHLWNFLYDMECVMKEEKHYHRKSRSSPNEIESYVP